MPSDAVRKHVFWFTHNRTPNVADLLQRDPEFHVHRLSYAAPPAENWAVMAAGHAYCIGSARDEVPDLYKGTAALVARCPALLVVSTAGAGYDTVDVAACTAAGVLVVNQSGANAEAVAEHTVGMLLALTKQIVETDRAVRTVTPPDREAFKGRTARGRTLGVIGLGQAGRRVARICRHGLEMRVLAYDPYLTDAECEERGAERVALDTLLAQADFVTVHCPLTGETKGMIGRRQLAMMRPRAVLINTARGGIVDEGALLAALETGHLAGAGVDVWEVEPPAAHHPLLARANVIATCHTAGLTVEARLAMAEWNAEQLVRIFRGARPPRLVNPEAWERFSERFARTFGIRPGA